MDLITTGLNFSWILTDELGLFFFSLFWGPLPRPTSRDSCQDRSLTRVDPFLTVFDKAIFLRFENDRNLLRILRRRQYFVMPVPILMATGSRVSALQRLIVSLKD